MTAAAISATRARASFGSRYSSMNFRKAPSTRDGSRNPVVGAALAGGWHRTQLPARATNPKSQLRHRRRRPPPHAASPGAQSLVSATNPELHLATGLRSLVVVASNFLFTSIRGNRRQIRSCVQGENVAFTPSRFPSRRMRLEYSGGYEAGRIDRVPYRHNVPLWDGPLAVVVCQPAVGNRVPGTLEKTGRGADMDDRPGDLG